ncbi:MAG: glycerophosphodiester phosphodiesterase [Candidatus Lokiarchaeota archaeon]|nr:glycerophosphodiester phosphodiesterase [Candidatus Lokiarchaeota archaeon]
MNAFTFEVIGHRGCEGLAPENSLAAMRKAIELGIDRVEFDVVEAKDGELIVLHDKLIRVGLRSIPACQLGRQAIARARKASLDEVPLLDEVLGACKGRIKIQAELKAGGIEARVASALERAGFPVADTSISSFDTGRLVRMHDLAPSLTPVQLVYLASKGVDLAAAIAAIKRAGIGTLSMPASRVTSGLVRLVHDHGLRAIAWGIGEKGRRRHEINSAYRSLLDKGVDGFTCAYPDVLVEMVRAARSTA